MEYEQQLSSTPKLSLSKLPSKPREYPSNILTPPIKSLASIPFQWEVAPGQPKTTTTTATTTTPPPPPPKPKPAAARCLDLPPRLFHNDGGQATNYMPMPSPTTVFDGPYDRRRSFSQPLSFSFRKQRSSSRYGSWRLGSFKEERKIVNVNGGSNVKITRIRRKASFLNFFGKSSINPLAGIYESFKLAVPWGRRQERA